MALLSFRGISTPSLPAQGEQRRSSYFNIPRGNSIEASDHDLWVIDERLAFARYFASDVPFTKLIEDSKNTERSDLLIFDRLHGLGFNEEGHLRLFCLLNLRSRVDPTMTNDIRR
jgi:hypothetical protein